jgi:hypothetical protein
LIYQRRKKKTLKSRSMWLIIISLFDINRETKCIKTNLCICETNFYTIFGLFYLASLFLKQILFTSACCRCLFFFPQFFFFIIIFITK